MCSGMILAMLGSCGIPSVTCLLQSKGTDLHMVLRAGEYSEVKIKEPPSHKTS